MTRPQAPRACDFMTRHVYSISADNSLEEIISFLQKHRISSAPVTASQAGKQHVLIGFISEGDCLEHLTNEIFFGRPTPPQNALTIMKRHPVCAAPDTDIFALASIFTNHGYRHLPIVDGNELVGIVSRRDLLKALNEYYRDAINADLMDRFPPDLRKVSNLHFIAESR